MAEPSSNQPTTGRRALGWWLVNLNLGFAVTAAAPLVLVAAGPGPPLPLTVVALAAGPLALLLAAVHLLLGALVQPLRRQRLRAVVLTLGCLYLWSAWVGLHGDDARRQLDFVYRQNPQ
jgi:hypothetical protein